MRTAFYFESTTSYRKIIYILGKMVLTNLFAVRIQNSPSSHEFKYTRNYYYLKERKKKTEREGGAEIQGNYFPHPLSLHKSLIFFFLIYFELISDSRFRGRQGSQDLCPFDPFLPFSFPFLFWISILNFDACCRFEGIWVGSLRMDQDQFTFSENAVRFQI